MSSTRTLTVGLVAAFSAVAFIVYRRRQLRYQKRKRLEALLNGLVESEDVQVVETEAEWNKVASEMAKLAAKFRILGVDCEWVGQNKVALLQLGVANGRVVLVRLNKMLRPPKSLFGLLGDSRTLKVGVGVNEDAQKLLNDFGMDVKSSVDLRHLIRLVRPEGLRRSGLAGLAKEFLDVTMDKDWRIRAGDWEADILSERQIAYAAQDAICAVNVALKMALIVAETEDVDVGEVEELSTQVFYKMARPYRDLKVKVNKRGFVKETLPPRVKSIKDAKKSTMMPRKSPLYENSRLEAPDGQPLCVCDPKKADWYVSKGIGTLISRDPHVVRLKFEPKGRPEGDAGAYYLIDKENICAVCGETNSSEHARKYVVPHEYRKYFPDIMRDHQSHDVLLMCFTCHGRSNVADNALRAFLAEECDAPIGTESDVKYRDDPEAKRLRSAAKALYKDKEKKIPETRREELKRIVRDHVGDDVDLTEELLASASELELIVPNCDYIPHGKKVVDHFISSGEGAMALEVRWRKHFLETMNPKHLPPLWSVDHQKQRLEIKAKEKRIPQDEFRIASGINNVS